MHVLLLSTISPVDLFSSHGNNDLIFNDVIVNLHSNCVWCTVDKLKPTINCVMCDYIRTEWNLTDSK